MSKELGAVLDTAKDIITGARRKSYGPPEEGFNHLADLWSVILRHDVTPRQVALMMIALKVERHCAGEGDDDLVDICGYAALADVLPKKLAPLVESPARCVFGVVGCTNPHGQ